VGYRCLEGEGCGVAEGRVRWGWIGVVRASGRAHGWAGRDLGQGSRVDLRLFYPQFSTDSHQLGDNKVNRNPLIIILVFSTFASCIYAISLIS